MADVMPAIAWRSSQGGWRHSCADDQVVNIGVAVVVASAQHVIVVILSARIAHARGNFVDQPLKLLFRHIFHRFALASDYESICKLVGQGLLVFVGGTGRMNANGLDTEARSGNRDLTGKSMYE
jgi:hypothetical protein